MVSPIYPIRSLIKFKAKSQLIANYIGQDVTIFVNRQGKDPISQPIRPAEPSQPAGAGEPTAPRRDPEGCLLNEAFDEALFREITATSFHPNQHPELYQPCLSAHDAAEIEDQIATEIIQTYGQIQQSKKSELVQRLNSLL